MNRPSCLEQIFIRICFLFSISSLVNDDKYNDVVRVSFEPNFKTTMLKKYSILNSIQTCIVVLSYQLNVLSILVRLYDLLLGLGRFNSTCRLHVRVYIFICDVFLWNKKTILNRKTICIVVVVFTSSVSSEGEIVNPFFLFLLVTHNFSLKFIFAFYSFTFAHR